MPAQATDAAVAPPSIVSGEIVHIVCDHCPDDIALCGTDVRAARWAADEEDTYCVVCDDLLDQPCPRCGVIE